MRIVILAVGRAKPPFVDDCDHYLRLLRGRLRVELVEARDERRARERLPAEAHVVLLSERGRARTSLEFARWLERRLLAARDLWFVIGGPQGIDLAEADETLSLGPLTLPHQLARVVLLEQLFRAHKILAGEPYHY
ncbi:23S rRNA (pseudouridine(1915)-N(3))-methyltransferase RlmH [Thermoleophilum album]|uniref:23S rRNA (pseudouridine(1915)-N(3))-methyltransferase RlmH n=1 Tax=Thermoleophilum album TaxID=29539 RepID=UPI000B8102D8|nr:23S rRNA (pseudouridine(1915)-N(3))-methyltransferase RlmH [Thermoleophilum album]